MVAIKNRYDFVYLFDVRNGNPNGDPDNGNMPRIEPQTQKGLVTDVALKRKVRNYVDLMKGGQPPYAIYMRERAILNNLHREAYKALGLQPDTKKLPKDEAKARAITRWMCDNFFDIRAFGAVMTTEVNAGQVRGPIQMTFAESIDPIVPQEISITRSSVTNERDMEKERTMGASTFFPTRSIAAMASFPPASRAMKPRARVFLRRTSRSFSRPCAACLTTTARPPAAR